MPSPLVTVAMLPAVDAVLGCAIALDPVQELPGQPGARNRGYFVDAINTFCGSPLGSAWCLNFVHYVGVHALGIAWPFPERNGNCDWLLALATRRGLVRELPMRGGIFLRLNNRNAADANHAGYVERVFNDGSWRSVEGNGAEDGSAEGKAVVRLTRAHRADPKRYAYVDLPAALLAPAVPLPGGSR
jgi:hypothetical protein